MTVLRLRPGELERVSTLVRELTGVVLTDSKAYLIESRLAGLANMAGCSSFTAFADLIRKGANTALREQLIDAITTHETTFFRDRTPYEALLNKAIPESLDARAKSGQKRKLRIWSAACSSGQEPYSIAMILLELIPDANNWDIEILATDISKGTVDRASAGIYSPVEAQRSERTDLMRKHFAEIDCGWRISNSVRQLCRFEVCNLLAPLTGKGPFDIVFCRNVGIYFDQDTRGEMFRRIARVMCPHGWLFTGSSESLADLGERFEPQHHCGATIYQPNMVLEKAR